MQALGYLGDQKYDPSRLMHLILKCGKVNYEVLRHLDELNRFSYGEPQRVKVRTSPLKGKAILVSGHDLT